MGTHVREHESYVPSRRQALRVIGLSGLTAAVPLTAVALLEDPHARVERLFRELTEAVKALGEGTYIDHTAQNEVNGTAVWLIVAKNGNEKTLPYFLHAGSRCRAAEAARA